MSFGAHPIVLIAVIGALAALILIVLASRAKSRAGVALLVLLALVFSAPGGFLFVAFHPEWVDARFRTYKRFYRDIQIGMTREQVFAAMENRYPQSSPRKRPTIMNDTPEGLGFFMNPETSREPNCEGIFLTFEAGSITKIVYSAD
jgi:hypothetical protein